MAASVNVTKYAVLHQYEHFICISYCISNLLIVSSYTNLRTSAESIAAKK